MRISEAQHIYLVGVKGVGVSALAQLLLARGKHVQGWDSDEVFFTDAILERAGIAVETGSVPQKLKGVDLAVISNAYGPNHPARKEIARRRIPCISYAEAVAELFNNMFGIMVAGSHGKSTTSALIASILAYAKYDPTALIGTEVIAWQTNARAGAGKYFVLEGDEYAKTFFHYKPKLLVLTNVDWDHPDTYPTRRSYEAAFKKLVKSLHPEAHIVVFRGDKRLQKLLGSVSRHIDWYDALDGHATLPPALSGAHNRANVAAALRAVELLGISPTIAWRAIASFKGTRRRLELKRKRGNNYFIDDYAHHPTEVAATLEALRETYPHRALWVVFQPHTFTRTKVFLKEFAKTLALADKVLILDIYGSAREQQGKVSGKDIVERIGPKALYTPLRSDAVKYLKRSLPKGVVLATLGAGDVWKLHDDLLA